MGHPEDAAAAKLIEELLLKARSCFCCAAYQFILASTARPGTMTCRHETVASTDTLPCATTPSFCFIRSYHILRSRLIR